MGEPVTPSDKLSHLLNAHADACFMRDSDRALSARGQLTRLYADQDRLMAALRAFFHAVERESLSRSGPPIDWLAAAAQMAQKQDELQVVFESVEANLSA